MGNCIKRSHTLIEGRNEKKVLLERSHCDPENEFTEVSIKFAHLTFSSENKSHISIFLCIAIVCYIPHQRSKSKGMSW